MAAVAEVWKPVEPRPEWLEKRDHSSCEPSAKRPRLELENSAGKARLDATKKAEGKASTTASSRPKKAGSAKVVLVPFNVVSRQAPQRARDLPGRCLAKHATCDDPQVQQLNVMNKAFVDECTTGGTFIGGAATFAEKYICFIKIAGEEEPVGYLAFEEQVDHDVPANVPTMETAAKAKAAEAPLKLNVLQQICVKPSHRKKGLASAALELAFQNDEHAVIEAPVAATRRIMMKLGWQFCGARQAASSFFCRYVRGVA